MFGGVRVAVLSGGYEAETQLAASRMTVPPPAWLLREYDKVIRGAKAIGVWGGLSALNLIAAHDAQAARVNLRGNAAFNLAPVNSPTFTAFRGYAGDGATSYLDTGWAPNMGLQDDVSFGIWDRTDAQASNYVAGAADGTTLALNPRDSFNRMTGRANATSGGSGTSDAVPVGSGFTLLTRISASMTRGYHGATQVLSTNVASGAPGAVPLMLGRYSTSYNSHQFAASVIGRGMSAAQVAALNALLAAYMAAVGA